MEGRGLSGFKVFYSKIRSLDPIPSELGGLSKVRNHIRFLIFLLSSSVQMDVKGGEIKLG